MPKYPIITESRTFPGECFLANLPVVRYQLQNVKKSHYNGTGSPEKFDAKIGCFADPPPEEGQETSPDDRP